MCDTAVQVGSGRVLFAKNSDRDPNEAQLLDAKPRRRHPSGERVQCTWIEIPQVRETNAVLLSRPYWMWGAEMGANQHGLVIGNEAVFTDAALPERGLTGMDLLRLALERCESAEAAVETIGTLLERHGQGGGCGHEKRLFRYSSSFLLADPTGAFVLETAGNAWTAAPVRGARAISNQLTLEPFASEHARRLPSEVVEAELRRGRMRDGAQHARGPAEMMAILRDHGRYRVAPRYRVTNGAFGGSCVHPGGLLASSQTTASWVSELSRIGVRHFATGTAAPCTGLFKPVRVGEAVSTGPEPTERADGESLWWRHEALHRRVLRDPERLLPLYAEERDAMEVRFLADATGPEKAFAEADRALPEWTRRVAAADGPDRRPFLARRAARHRDERAGMRV